MVQAEQPVTRGTIQTIFLRKSFDELRRLKLSEEFEAELEIPKEILSTPPTLDAGPQGKIVPKMGVGHEENANPLSILLVAVI